VTGWSPEADTAVEDEADSELRTLSYVPIDPCQGVIMALRVALGERLPRKFIDLETSRFLPHSAVLPDPYALKTVPLERFSAAILPHIPRLPDGQPQQRVLHMARRLRELERQYQSILLVCSVLHWPWIREAYMEQTPAGAEDEEVQETVIYEANRRTLIFLLANYRSSPACTNGPVPIWKTMRTCPSTA